MTAARAVVHVIFVPGYAMSIAVSCGTCGKSFKTKEENAGRRAKRACGAILTVPIPAPPPPPPPAENPPFDFDALDQGEYDLAEALPPQKPAAPLRPLTPLAAPTAREKTTPATRMATPLAEPMRGGFLIPPRLRDHAYVLLLLVAMIPLTISTLASHDGERLKDRLLNTIKHHPEAAERIEKVLDDDRASEDDLFNALPGHKLDDALLSHDSWAHWLYALLAAAAFLGAAAFLFPRRSATVRSLALTGLFTGTLGILFLLAVQFAAEWSQGIWLRGRGIIVLLFYIVKFIGFSYRAALGDTNFVLSLAGFTFGVGMCEEICKALPVIWLLRRDGSLGWRAACLWGFVSGAGFGVSEGITYCSDFYNGISGAEIYFVRFASCVALHAVWSAAGAISLYRHQARLGAEDHFLSQAATVAAILAVPIVLHGLYDTLLKKEMSGYALIVALASVVWLATRVTWGQKVEADPNSGYAMASGTGCGAAFPARVRSLR